MDTGWWYLDGNQNVGPLSLSDLLQRITNAQIGMETLVWRVGWKDWHELAAVQGIQAQVLAAIAEAKKRSPIGDDSIPLAQTAADSHLAQTEVARLRIATREAYEKAFALKKAEGRPESICCTMALTSAVYSRLLASPDAPPICDEVTQVILMECAPFEKLTPKEGMAAIIEYVVWREYPNLANEELIASAVRKMKLTYSPELIDGFKTAPFPWVRFL